MNYLEFSRVCPLVLFHMHHSLPQSYIIYEKKIMSVTAIVRALENGVHVSFRNTRGET